MSTRVLEIDLTSGRGPLKIKREVCYRRKIRVDNNEGHEPDDDKLPFANE